VALTAALAIVTGILGLIAGMLRLGFIAAFISEPVLKGFIVGLALTILIGQVPKFLGVPKTEVTSSSRPGVWSPTSVTSSG
jgi:MFS superfamily sulfate permease-like transporter